MDRGGVEKRFEGVSIQYYLRGTDLVLFPVWAIEGELEVKSNHGQWRPAGASEEIASTGLRGPSPAIRFVLRNLLADTPYSGNAVSEATWQYVARNHVLDAAALRLWQPKVQFPFDLTVKVGQVSLAQVKVTREHHEAREGRAIEVYLDGEALATAGESLGRRATCGDLQFQIQGRVFSQLESRSVQISLSAFRGQVNDLCNRIRSEMGEAIDWIIPTPGGEGETLTNFRQLVIKNFEMHIATRRGEKVDSKVILSIADRLAEHLMQSVSRTDLAADRRVALMIGRQVCLSGLVGEISELARKEYHEREAELKTLVEKTRDQKGKPLLSLQASPSLLGLPFGFPSAQLGVGAGPDVVHMDRQMLDTAHKQLDEFQGVFEGRIKSLPTLCLDQRSIDRVFHSMQSEFTQAEFTTGYYLYEAPSLFPVVHRRVEDPGSFLVDAVRSAFPGKKITLEAGVYQLPEPLKIDKGLEIVGQGRGKTLIRWEREGPAILYAASGVLKLKDLSVERIGENMGDLFEATNGVLEIENCEFTGARSGSGIVLHGNVRGEVRNCLVHDNGEGGICVKGGAIVTLDGNTCEKNGAGILYLGSAKGVARKNVCRENLSHGIYVGSTGKISLESNTCNNNSDSGIRLSLRSTNPCQITLAGNRCEQNKYGIQIGAGVWVWKGDKKVLRSGQKNCEAVNYCQNNRSENWQWNYFFD